MQVLGQHKSPTESYTSIYQCINTGYNKIECITPANQTDAECFKELKLFTILSALPHDNPLCTSLITQENLTLEGTATAMLCVDTGKKFASTEVEQAHAALGGCWLCSENDHIHCNCPTRKHSSSPSNRTMAAGANIKSERAKTMQLPPVQMLPTGALPMETPPMETLSDRH